MEIVYKNKNAAIVIPPGNIDITNSAYLKDSLGDLLNKGYLNIDVDFKNVNIIDSTALGRLLLCHKNLREKGGRLKIINLCSDYVEKIFNTIHLSKFIEYEKENDSKL